MLLESFNNSKRIGFKKINKLLKENYGIKMSPTVATSKLLKVSELIQENIRDLKISGACANTSPEISKNLLILEGIRNIVNDREVYNEGFGDGYQMVNPYKNVLQWLSEFVCNNVELGDPFNDALANAMKEYRSSQWRFPDDKIQMDLRDLATANLIDRDRSYMDHVMTESCGCRNGHKLSDILDTTELNNVKEWVATSGRSLSNNARSKLHDHYAKLGFIPGQDADIHDWYQHRLTSDFRDDLGLGAKQSTPMIKRISNQEECAMREGYIRRLRVLLESEVDEAEAIVGARSLSNEIQEMIQKVGRIMNEKLPPLIDQMRETYGEPLASEFQHDTTISFQRVMESLYSAKDQIDSGVFRIAGKEDMETQMDMDVAMDQASDVATDIGMGAELGDEIGDEFGEPSLDDELGGMEDDFAGAADEEPLGHARKESVEVKKLMNQLSEMQKLVDQARKLKESKRKT